MRLLSMTLATCDHTDDCDRPGCLAQLRDEAAEADTVARAWQPALFAPPAYPDEEGLVEPGDRAFYRHGVDARLDAERAAVRATVRDVLAAARASDIGAV